MNSSQQTILQTTHNLTFIRFYKRTFFLNNFLSLFLDNTIVIFIMLFIRGFLKLTNMREKHGHKKIFEYLDYRELLKDYYQQKKNANPSFSLRVFSDKIGFKAKDFISRIMNGDKNLSIQSIPKVAKGLKIGRAHV